MHSTHPTGETHLQPTPATRRVPRGHRRLVAFLWVLLAFLLLTFIPPLFNVSRFHRRIADNIAAAIGRPVHFDSLSLNLLPMPGFTLNNFVVDEAPGFGAEPILRAQTVRANIRIRSLWRHAEFSTISLTEPSVNLIRAADGHWNIESLLLQASHLDAAPTAQRFAGSARRFPYIQATGARLNLKFGDEKTPFSLTDADFALWLPEPQQWHLRLEAHPMRTDTSPGDTGAIRIEGTLGAPNQHAASLAGIPIDLQGDWRDAQLGGIGRLLLGRDPSLRGEVSLSFTARGSIGRNTIAADIKLAKARRADFVPAQLLSVEASCNATATDTFRSFTSIECQWPPPESSDRAILILTGELPDVRDIRSASAVLTIPALPAGTFFDILGVATPHPPAGTGTFSGQLTLHPTDDPSAHQPALTGELEFSTGSIDLNLPDRSSIPIGDVMLQSPQPEAAPPTRSHSNRAGLQAVPRTTSFGLAPIELPLGGKQPAILEGHFDADGYSLHLTGSVLAADLIALGNAIPQIGEGLKDALPPGPASPGGSAPPDAAPVPIHVDLTATRIWGHPQIWSETSAPAPHHPRR